MPGLGGLLIRLRDRWKRDRQPDRPATLDGLWHAGGDEAHLSVNLERMATREAALDVELLLLLGWVVRGPPERRLVPDSPIGPGKEPLLQPISHRHATSALKL